MAVTGPVLLAPDAVLTPVAGLPEALRSQLGAGPEDLVLTLPRARAASCVVDARCAALLEEFRAPGRIVDAVLRFSRAGGLDPDATLIEAFPLLERLLSAGFLLPAGGADAGGIRPLLSPGDVLGGDEPAGPDPVGPDLGGPDPAGPDPVGPDPVGPGPVGPGPVGPDAVALRVLACVQVLEDTELHLVRGREGMAALKLERRVGSPVGAMLEREATLLRHLEGAPTPRLLREGRWGGRGSERLDGRRYLLLSWCPGIDAGAAAGELRREPTGRGRAGLLELCLAIVKAYAALHARGVVHGDVHPRNLLVSGEGQVRVIDFGLSSWIAGAQGLAGVGRGGVAFYFEPEYADAVRAGRRPPAPSPAGEQYAVAALLYHLVTGGHYRDFSLEKEEMLRQIAEDPPLPFTARGVRSWPELEAILDRALRKPPGERFGSLEALGGELEALEAGVAAWDRSDGAWASGASRRRTEARGVVEEVIRQVDLEGRLFVQGIGKGPRASIMFGAAGIALGVRRMALVREDARLLSLADLWSEKAQREAGDEGFYDGGELTRQTVGEASPYHTASGLHATQALVAHALGDPFTVRRALNRFLEASRAPCPSPDLTLGRAGLLLACALLLEATRGGGVDLAGLSGLGDGLMRGLWAELEALPAVSAVLHPGAGGVRPGDGGNLPNLGMAHGWAGLLYASLRWCSSRERPLPESLEHRLLELADCAEPWGRGLRWPWRWGRASGGHRSMPGWCNGSAGLLHLWVLAHQRLGDERFQTLARGCAWHVSEDSARGADLCCGLAGRGYALLRLYQHEGEGAWLERARALAALAIQEVGTSARTPHSLYQGALGVAALAVDLERPEQAAQPFFGVEG